MNKIFDENLIEYFQVWFYINVLYFFNKLICFVKKIEELYINSIYVYESSFFLTYDIKNVTYVCIILLFLSKKLKKTLYKIEKNK